jgi:SH3-like domain-containing protein
MWKKITAVASIVMMAGLLPASAAKMMSVQVRNGQVRATPSFLGQVVSPVAYGDQVEIVQQQGVWMQVKTSDGKSGWIHQSALSKKKIVMAAGDEDVKTGASGEELALAGKGFNSDVEASFKAQNKNIDFTWVDKMEKIKISAAEQREFLKEGDVKPAQGGIQ